MRIIKGTIFCQVVRTRQIGQFKAFIVEGNQKWKGAIPNFTIILGTIKRYKEGELELRSSNLDPRA